MFPQIAAFPTLPDTPTNARSPEDYAPPLWEVETRNGKAIGAARIRRRGAARGWGVAQAIRSASSYGGAVSFKKRH